MKEKYDVVIIGAGIGGLVCGCYLAKAGLKVLIVEKNDKPGGYCSSFERDGYRFDAGAHYFGGIKKGVLGGILRELKIKNKIKFHQLDPSCKIILPDRITYIRANPYDTLKELGKTFPKERRNLQKFFKSLLEGNFLILCKKFRNVNCEEILSYFFKDERLKFLLKGLMLNGLGCFNFKEIPAIVMVTFLREFILDPGYYPLRGGIQKLPDVLTEEFKNFGGKMMLKSEVKEIIIHRKKVGSVFLEKDEIKSKAVVSSCDAFLTFRTLLKVNTQEAEKVEKMKPSLSGFMIYLGIKENLNQLIHPICNFWLFPYYKIKKSYFTEFSTEKIRYLPIVVTFPSFYDFKLSSQDKSIIEIFSPVSYKSAKFWNENKEIFFRFLVKRVEEYIYFSQKIEKKIIATPIDFYNYTFNQKGSLFGWLPTKEQIHITTLPQKSSLKGLFLASHWCSIGTTAGGISGVAASGRRAAFLVMKYLNYR